MADGTLKVGTIQTSSGTGTITLGQSGETVNFPSGVTLTTVDGINVPAFSVRRSADQSFSAGAWTKIQFDSEGYDTNNFFDSTTNYRFTPTIAGKYLFCLNGGLIYTGTAAVSGIGLYKNATFEANTVPYISSMNSGYVLSVSTIIDLNGSSDYVEAYVYTDATSPSIVDSRQETFFQGCLISGA